ncbi:ATPase [Labilibacter marinus]|uniref:ATPase n=1 Tax=Labilibacter marinus TaxID=1477105 RepID=UPI00094F8F55|nr:ATPase [Labilibacter marinus]
MILIADSGSTKTEWQLIESKHPSQTCFTKGINPFYQSVEDIIISLKSDYSLIKDNIDNVYFYGAGCANEEQNNIVKEALSSFFNGADIQVNSDLLGAAHSLCQDKPGIACILGTGSNSCYYNGKEIIENVSPLGYILGDEGSGAVLGKLLMADLLKNQLPSEIQQLFYETYKLTPQDIMNAVYKEPFPNRYLAQFSQFMIQQIHHPEIEAIVSQSFNDFINRNLLQYSRYAELPIHFTGSIAFYFKQPLSKAIQQHSLQLGQVTASPMQGLIEYHINHE